jgi:2-amino-4-hydroxy-6-hydroxymethyldihydropteridine diphosphokinase
LKLETENLKLTCISLGSNLGDRLAHLGTARERLRALAAPSGVFLSAPVYRSEPVDCPPESPDFFNTVVAFQFAGSARDLLRETQRIESDLGRPAERAVNAPRPIDLDILVFGGKTVNEPDLVIPHPRLPERRFVLQPLADILPGLVPPGGTATVARQLDRLGNSARPCTPLPPQDIRDGYNSQ